ncbi:MAG: stalk domain-containing protein [Bacillota bacterium]
MKKRIFFILIFSIVFLLSGLLSAQELVEDNPGIETSIVLLTLFDSNEERVYEEDDFFEIFYFSDQDYVLIPTNLIAPYLEVDINFNRELSLLTMEKGDREIQIDLNEKEYLEHQEWNDKPPVISGGEFYLAAEVFEYLTDYKISWNNARQELYIEGEFIEESSQEDTTDQEDTADQETEEKAYRQEEILGDERPFFQLSSVHYRMELNLEDRVFGNLNKMINGDLNFYGRVGDWAYYLNNDLSYNLDNEEIDYNLERIKLKYQENNILVIAGDHNIKLTDTMNTNKMQGIYFSMPDSLAYKLIPYTDLKIEAAEGDQLNLFVNGNLIKKQNIKDDREFTFKNIELRSRYLNKIEVIKINSDGEEERTVRYLAGSSDILRPQVREVELMAGRYSDGSYSEEDWTGYFGALKSSYAVTENISAHLETAIYNQSLNPESSFEDEILSSIIGLSLRASDSAVINLDWLIAGEFDNLETGAQAELIYSFLRGYIRGIYLYIPPETAEYMEKDEGEDKSISFRLDLSNDISLNPTVGQRNTLEDRIDETNYYNFKIIYNPGWRNYNALSLNYEDNRADYYFSDQNDQIFTFIGDRIRKGVRLENDIYGDTFRVSSDLAYYDNDLKIADFRSDNYQDYEAELDLYKRVGSNLLLSLNYDGEQRRDNNGLRYYDRNYNGQLRFSTTNRTSLTLGSSRREEESENRIEEESFLRLNYNFNREFSLTGELTDYHSEFARDYRSLNLSGNYYFGDNPGYLRLFAEYIVPDEGDPGTSFGATYDIVRDDESQIKIELRREYAESINENDYENFASISYSHAISFMGDQQKKTRFTDFEPRPIVAGYAYLDENYNGKMDEGEKKLADIPMRLGSMMTFTDENGFFIFKPYFRDVYQLNFDYSNLTADYTPVTDSIMVRVKDNQNISQNFGVTINGTVSGRIFIDKNANGKKDENEDYLTWVGMEIEGLNKKDYTDKRGEFYFQNVPLGEHTLVVLKESLPSGTKPLNGYSQDINITEDKLDHQGIEIPIVYGD